MDAIPVRPVAAIVGQYLVTALAVGFTNFEQKGLRKFLLIPVLLAIPYYISTASTMKTIAQANFGGAGTGLTLFQYLDVVLINKWDFRYSGPRVAYPPGEPKPEHRDREDTTWNRLLFGLYAAASFRKCGTPFETKGVRQFHSVPSRTQFVLRVGVHLVMCYLLLDAITSLRTAEEVSASFAESKMPLFSRLRSGEATNSELIERVIYTFSFWLMIYLVMTTSAAIASLIMMALGLTPVTWWKPAFNFGHGFPYSVRRSWSHCWHLIVKDRIYAPSQWIADKVLRLPRGSQYRRYGILFLTFVMSGAFHALGDIAGGIPFSKTGAPFFFLVQVPAIMLEDLVQGAYRFLFPSKTPRAGPQLWQKVIGWVWFVSFLVWVTPFFAYPWVLHNGDALVVPFSVLRWARTRIAMLGDGVLTQRMEMGDVVTGHQYLASPAAGYQSTGGRSVGFALGL